MKLNKKDMIILLAPLLAAAVLYPFLPQEIPRQIGFSGELRYANKEFIFLIALLPFIVYRSYKAKRSK